MSWRTMSGSIRNRSRNSPRALSASVAAITRALGSLRNAYQSGLPSTKRKSSLVSRDWRPAYRYVGPIRNLTPKIHYREGSRERFRVQNQCTRLALTGRVCVRPPRRSMPIFAVRPLPGLLSSYRMQRPSTTRIPVAHLTAARPAARRAAVRMQTPLTRCIPAPHASRTVVTMLSGC